MGFSTNTCRPAWAAASPSGCELPGATAVARALAPGAVPAYRSLIGDLLAVARSQGVALNWWSPWNEPNDGSGPDVSPETAAAFWLVVARTDCATRACGAVIAGDFNDAAPDLAAYERRYVAALAAAGADADATDWGIHPYAAVNRERSGLEALGQGHLVAGVAMLR